MQGPYFFKIDIKNLKLNQLNFTFYHTKNQKIPLISITE